MHNTKIFLFQRNYTNLMEFLCWKIYFLQVGFSYFLEIILKSPAEKLEIWTGDFFWSNNGPARSVGSFRFWRNRSGISKVLIERKNPNRMTEAKSHTEREIDHVGSRLGSKGLKISLSDSEILYGQKGQAKSFEVKNSYFWRLFLCIDWIAGIFHI